MPTNASGDPLRDVFIAVEDRPGMRGPVTSVVTGTHFAVSWSEDPDAVH